MIKSQSLARALTQFSQEEVKALFQAARTVLREKGLEIRKTAINNSFGRILIIIPKKVGNAPKRNLIRRRIKSIFYQEKLYEKKYDFICFVYPYAAQLTFIDLKELLIKGTSLS